jgi:serine/threonine protein kinase/Tol biopolymer transport system component
LTSAREQQIQALFRAALERPPEQRASFVSELSGGDDEVRRSVERLLTQKAATDIGVGAAPSDEHSPDLPAGTMLGQFRIDAVVGRGGMGVVYRATDTKLGRPVAIKFLSAAVMNPDVGRRFRQEAKTASSLNHPHIVTVHDVGEHDGRQYIVSELVDGGTLEDWSVATRRRTWRQSVELLIGVADALAAANAAGVLHRDVKPSNILIGANGYAKLADFGLAKLVDPDARNAGVRGDALRITGVGVVVGTVAYMSPEQAAGQPLDARSDIFSFGIVLYELLAGRRPFEGTNDLGILKAIAHATPEPLPDTVPEALRLAVDKALEKDPADRYQTMQELVVDLRRAARKTTSSQAAVTASDVQIVAGVVKRHPRVLLAAGALVVLTLAAGLYLAFPRATDPTPPVADLRRYELTQLTTSGTAYTPAISPDGRYVAYAQPEGDIPLGSIWIRQIATPGSARTVAPEAGVVIGAPTFDPDGEFLSFVRGLVGAPMGAELWRSPFLGGAPKLLATDVSSPAGWSPDGRQMAFVRVDTAGSSSLVVVGADGTERVLARRAQPAYFVSLWIIGNPAARPAWSPDGKVIALLEFKSLLEPHVVFVDAVTGAETVRSSGGSFVPQGLAWLGPTSLVLSQPEEFGQRVQLWRMSYPGGEVTPLTNDLSSYIGVDVDASRQNLVTSRRDTRIAVWVGGADGTGGKEIVRPTPFGGVHGYVTWAGDRVLYDTTSNGRAAVAEVPAGGGEPEEVVANGFQIAATPDGSDLVFVRTSRGADGLWKVAAGRQSVQLVPGFEKFGGFVVEPLVSPDGRYVIFISNRSGIQTPWIVSIEGGEPMQVVAEDANDLDISPDGRRLKFVTQNERGAFVVVCDLPSCSNRHEFSWPENFGVPGRWTPDGRSLAYVERTGANIWALPLDGGAPSQITHFAADAARWGIGAFAWSHDGARLAVVRTTETNDIVLLRLRE